MGKRMLSMLLVLAMLVSVLPTGAAAEGVEPKVETVAETEEVTGETTEKVAEEVTEETVEEETEAEVTEETTGETDPEEETQGETELAEETEEIENGQETFEADGVVASGTCGKNLTWTLTEDGVLSVSGSGKMADYSLYSATYNPAPWYEHKSKIKTVKIGEGILTIGTCAFSSIYTLQNVSIPNGITEIGTRAFGSCNKMLDVIIPNSVLKIDDFAFEGCSSLKNVDIPYGVEYIGIGAFSNCARLVAISIPNSVQTIGNMAFSDCKALTSIAIPDSVNTIGSGTLSNCSSLTDAKLPYGLSSITNGMFAGCTNLVSIDIPDSVTEIDHFAFSGCKTLTSLEIPEGVTTLGNCSINGCSQLVTIYLPGSLLKIGERAFEWSDALKDVYYAGNEEKWDMVEIDERNDPLLNADIHFGWQNPAKKMDLVDTSPKNGDTDVELDAPLILTFSQEVNEKLDWSKGKICILDADLHRSVAEIGESEFNELGGHVDGKSLVIPSVFKTEWLRFSTSGKLTLIIPDGLVVAKRSNHGKTIAYKGSNEDITFTVKRDIIMTEFDVQKDVFKFANREEYFKKPYYLDRSTRELLESRLDNKAKLFLYVYFGATKVVGFRGLCYGISTLMGLLGTGRLDITQIDNRAISAVDLSYPMNNKTLFTYLSYYNFIQFMADENPYSEVNEFMQGIWGRRLVQEITEQRDPIVVGITNTGGAHTVLAYAIDEKTDPDNYIIYIADPNLLMEECIIDDQPVRASDGRAQKFFKPAILYLDKDTFFISETYTMDRYSRELGNYDYYYKNLLSVTALSNFEDYRIQDHQTCQLNIFDANDNSKENILLTTALNFTIRSGEKVSSVSTEAISGNLSVRGPFNIRNNAIPGDFNVYFVEAGDKYILQFDENQNRTTYVQFADTDKAIAAESDAKVVCFSKNEGISIQDADRMSKLFVTPQVDDVQVFALSFSTHTKDLALKEERNGYLIESTENIGEITLENLTGLEESESINQTVNGKDAYAVIDYSEQSGKTKIYADMSLKLNQSYIAIVEGETYKQLTATVEPEAWNPDVTWESENPDIVMVDREGNATGIRAGTGYVLATIHRGQRVLSARCRVDVTEQKPNEEVLGIDLTSPKVTTDLYSTDYTQIDILPRLPQNEVAAFAATPEDNGAAITGAYLEDETARALFDLRVKDDRTLLVVPTQAAIEGAKGVKSSYSSKLAVSVNGVEYHTAEAVTIGVKKTLPKLKAGKLTFNPFYTGQSQALNITGGTVTKIEGTVPDWLELDGTKLTLKNAPKSGSASVNLLVYTEEWAVPVSVKVNVKLSYKAPAVKLSASSVSLSDSESKGTTLKLSAGKKTLEALGVESIRLPEGFEETVLDLSTGEFTLVPTGVIPTGKQTVRVYFYDTDAVLDLPLTVTQKRPALKLSKSSVSLNGDLGDSVTLKVTATPVDLDLTKVVVTNPNEAVEVSPVNADGEFTVAVKAGTAPKANFSLTIQAPTGKAVKLTVKTLAAGQKVTMSLKAVGSIDLTYPEKGVDIQPIFKNYSGKLENIEYDLGDFLTLGEDDLLRWNGNIGLTTGTYPVTVTGNLPDGTVLSGTVKVKVIQTAVALKLSKTSLSLNKHLKENVQIAVTSGTKGYTLGTLGIRVTDSKNVLSDGLTAAYADGLLTLAVNDRTAYGSTYKVQLWATSNKISTVTVKIPAEKASAVTMTAKAKGQIDVIRDASQVLVTPSYKNCLDGQTLDKQVNVTWAKDGKNYTQDVTGRFDLNWADGALQVSRMPGETLELTGKYRLEILCEGMEKPAYVNLPVKSGTAKVTAAPVYLYTKDANHRAELTFMSSDRTLNAVARVELKDAKLKASYEVLDLGDGQFALRLRPSAKAKNGTVTVNLFFEGNNGKKPNATASVKVEIR